MEPIWIPTFFTLASPALRPTEKSLSNALNLSALCA
jgi:hypothetical protein